MLLLSYSAIAWSIASLLLSNDCPKTKQNKTKQNKTQLRVSLSFSFHRGSNFDLLQAWGCLHSNYYMICIAGYSLLRSCRHGPQGFLQITCCAFSDRSSDLHLKQVHINLWLAGLFCSSALKFRSIFLNKTKQNKIDAHLLETDPASICQDGFTWGKFDMTEMGSNRSGRELGGLGREFPEMEWRIDGFSKLVEHGLRRPGGMTTRRSRIGQCKPCFYYFLLTLNYS